MIRFSKYHGCGNDFVILTEEAAAGRPYPELAGQICHRQLGVGADGLIIVRREPLERRRHAYGFRLRKLRNSSLAKAREFLYGTYQTFDMQMWLGAQVNCRNPKPSVQRFKCRASIRQRQRPFGTPTRFARCCPFCQPSELGAKRRLAHGDSNRTSRLEMIYFNSDGSRAPMCGNGIRCFAKYCSDEGIRTEDEYPVETLAGTMQVKIVSREPFLVEISMGRPDFDPRQCGIETDREDFLKQTLQLKNGRVKVSSCFMGTIHTVVWLDELGESIWKDPGGGAAAGPFEETAGLEALGKEICGHPVFTKQTNVNFVRVLDRQTLKLITYERGAGMTLACGTGACAGVVIGALEGRCDRDADVLLPFGKLRIVQKSDDEVMMTGPAVRTARGYFEE